MRLTIKVAKAEALIAKDGKTSPKSPRNTRKRPSSITEISEIHGLPVSTTYRLILELERAGLVVAEKVGRERVVRPTLKGRLVARIEANVPNRR